MKKILLLGCCIFLFMAGGHDEGNAFIFGQGSPGFCPPQGCPPAALPSMGMPGQPMMAMPMGPPPQKRISKCKPAPVAACLPPTCAPPVCGPVCKPVCGPFVRWY